MGCDGNARGADADISIGWPPTGFAFTNLRQRAGLLSGAGHSVDRNLSARQRHGGQRPAAARRPGDDRRDLSRRRVSNRVRRQVAFRRRAARAGLRAAGAATSRVRFLGRLRVSSSALRAHVFPRHAGSRSPCGSSSRKRRAISRSSFLQSQPKDQPFFLTVQMGPPHDPYGAPEEYMRQYVPERITPPENWRPGSESRPKPAEGKRPATAAFVPVVPPGGLEEIAAYYAADHGGRRSGRAPDERLAGVGPRREYDRAVHVGPRRHARLARYAAEAKAV